MRESWEAGEQGGAAPNLHVDEVSRSSMVSDHTKHESQLEIAQIAAYPDRPIIGSCDIVRHGPECHGRAFC